MDAIKYKSADRMKLFANVKWQYLQQISIFSSSSKFLDQHNEETWRIYGGYYSDQLDLYQLNQLKIERKKIATKM